MSSAQAGETGSLVAATGLDTDEPVLDLFHNQNLASPFITA